MNESGEKQGFVETAEAPGQRLPKIRAGWALQADVLNAAIKVLQEGGPEVKLIDVAEAAFRDDVVQTSNSDMRQTLRNYLKMRHNTTFERGGAQLLLDDLLEQRAWLAECKNLPPLQAMTALRPEIRDGIIAKYGPKNSSN